MKNIDKYRGCLIGGAAGDALGYAVEFMDLASIKRKYGQNGITAFDLHNGLALISDDTQMTLFTANGLLLGITRGMTRGIMGTLPSYIRFCYKDWYKTQTKQYPLHEDCIYAWLSNVPEMFAQRAPGNTCLSAIESGCNGKLEEPVNGSKGCGGVMRVAPIGLYLPDNENMRMSQDEIDMIGAETAALTHGHPLGCIPAAALAHIVSLASHWDGLSLTEIVDDMKIAISEQFADGKYLSPFIELVDKAVALAKSNMSNEDAIRQLGEGWVAEETLAIAIYCAVKYEDDFEKALIVSVNHDGDSDSTGAVTGNILGAYLGLSKIPSKFIDNLELKEIILDMADDLYNDCQMTEYGSYFDPVWEHKYIERDYTPKKGAGYNE
ncbi:ADP-ribosylglycohydrolase [gut metagenome]|uniref:ADP-ribosylglycohydrolase n=1 Tax=gut metagenome TaxID=749906 RepID=J9CYK1_9ZZZZ